jgi:competence protein ComEC
VPEKIAPPRNPGSFDYAAYLSNQKIYHQIQLRPKRYFLLPAKPLQCLELHRHFKAKAISRIQSNSLSSSAADHWLALIFGEKQYLESDLRDAYAQAGVVHLLAISGLHIGIISFAVSWLLLPLLRIRYGKWLQQGLRLTVSWSFALWTGFQPAVVRAVTFFSLLDLSHWGKRP